MSDWDGGGGGDGGCGLWWGGEGGGGRMRCEASSTESRVMSQGRLMAWLLVGDAAVGDAVGDAAAEEALEEASGCSCHLLLLLLLLLCSLGSIETAAA